MAIKAGVYFVDIIKSPMNYSGNKHYAVGAIKEHFPDNVDTFHDLFCGGCDIIANVGYRRRIANDSNIRYIEIYKAMQESPDPISYIEKSIFAGSLTKTDEEAFEKFAKRYNTMSKKNRNPLDLYILICFSRNYAPKFDSRGHYIAPMGRGRNSFNPSMKKNMEDFLPRIKRVEFTSLDYKKYPFDSLTSHDFLYCDPPNVFQKNDWTEEDDQKLFGILANLSTRGVRFALSSFASYKGTENTALMDWVQNGYIVRDIEEETGEVLITNY